MIDVLNNKSWLGVNIDKTGSGYSNRCVDSPCVVSVIENQGDAIGRLSHNLYISYK